MLDLGFGGHFEVKPIARLDQEFLAVLASIFQNARKYLSECSLIMQVHILEFQGQAVRSKQILIASRVTACRELS